MSDYARGLNDPFLTHLTLLLSAYELCPMSSPLPRYDGPSDWHTDSILRSLSVIARRMYTAEDALASIKATESWQALGPETKKRRSVGDTPIPYSYFSQNDPVTSQPSTMTTKPSNAARNGFFSNKSDTPVNSADGSADIEMLAEDATVGVADVDRAPSTRPISSRVQNMSLSLDDIPQDIDFSKLQRTISNSSTSAPSTSHVEHVFCPTCGKMVPDSTMSRIHGSFNGSPSGSPLVVPPGPLTAAAFESGMSAVEELRLLKAQVQDVARVCNAVARGDLSQKITVPVQGVVMVQLKDVINTMVFPE